MKPFGLTIMGATLALAGCAAVPPFKGNESGGIIAWSPETQEFRHQIAAEHCAQYGRLHRITSVHARYGDYIGFSCYWPRRHEPGSTTADTVY